MKEIQNRNLKDELHKTDSFEDNKIYNTKIDPSENCFDTSEIILCEECEYALIVGLKSRCNNLNYCSDCAMGNVLVKAGITYKEIFEKNIGRNKK